MMGITKGLKSLFPDRFTSDGKEYSTCIDQSGKTYWGTANCEKVVDDYKKTQGNPTPLYNAKDAAVTANIVCYTDNDKAFK
jgi:hypothetical protein